MGSGARNFYGSVYWNSAPFRKPGHPWYIPKSTYPEERYPPYAVGDGYVLPMEAVECCVKIKVSRQLPFKVAFAHRGEAERLNSSKWEVEQFENTSSKYLKQSFEKGPTHRSSAQCGSSPEPTTGTCPWRTSKPPYL